MARLHLDSEDRLRLARYFDPPMYVLVVGTVVCSGLVALVSLFGQVRSALGTAASAIPLPSDLVTVTWLVPFLFFFGSAAATLLVFFVLHERDRPDEPVVAPVIEGLEGRLLDPDTVLIRLGLAYDDLRHPVLTASETYLAPTPRRRRPYVRREVDGFHRLSTRRAVLVAAAVDGLHVYECVYDLRSRAKLEVRTHRVAYRDIVDVASVETSRIRRLTSPLLGMSKRLILEERRIELALAGGELLTVPMAPKPGARLPGQVAEAVEPEALVRVLRDLLDGDGVSASGPFPATSAIHSS